MSYNGTQNMLTSLTSSYDSKVKVWIEKILQMELVEVLQLLLCNTKNYYYVIVRARIQVVTEIHIMTEAQPR